MAALSATTLAPLVEGPQRAPEAPRVARATRRQRRGGGQLSSSVLFVVVLAVTAVLGWNLLGGRLLVMETPSMCPRVCVGALVGERPLAGPLHVGELISFHPPGDDAETYTHEVARILPDGAIETRGIADPGHDPWLIERSDIVGKVDFTVWELGWLFKALPLFAVGTLFWVSARPFIGERWRRSWDRGCLTVLTVVPLWLLHPLVRASVIASTLEVPGHPHWASDSVVDTGILPAWFAEAGGRAVRVSSTDLGHVSGPLHAHGLFELRQAIALPGWTFTIVALAVASPLLGCIWHIFHGDEALAFPLPRAGYPRRLVQPRRSKFHLLARPELRSSPVMAYTPDRLRPADVESLAVTDKSRLLVDADEDCVGRRPRQHLVGETRDPMLETVEMGEDD